jgi:hypothetical protein
MSFLSGIFGEKPQIADYTPVDQLKALEGDLAAWPKISELGNLFQSYMLNQYETAIPGFKDILRMGGQTTQDMLNVSDKYLHGEIPEDVAGAVQRTSAFQNLLSGGGGAMASANTARNYGLTSMDLINKGASLAGEAGNAAQRWAALSGAQMPQGMLVTPQQQAELDMKQNLIKRNIEQQKFNVKAAPDPALQALNQWVEQVGGTVVASYLGGGAGGMGGGGGGGGGYKTSYNASEYLGGQSDVSNPGGYTANAGPGYSSPAFNDPGNAGYNYNNPAPSGGFDYGVGYPAANPNQYYGGTNPFTDYLYANSFKQGAFGG